MRNFPDSRLTLAILSTGGGLSPGDSGGNLTCKSDHMHGVLQGNQLYYMTQDGVNKFYTAACSYLKKKRPDGLNNGSGLGFSVTASTLQLDGTNDFTDPEFLDIRMVVENDLTCRSVLYDVPTDWNLACTDAMSTLVNGCMLSFPTDAPLYFQSL